MKKQPVGVFPFGMLTGLLCAAPFATVLAASLPVGGTVISGSGRINQTRHSLTLTQTSSKLVASWQSFSIGKGNVVNFHQPDANAVALNRVTGAGVSVIQGALNANGKVFLVNPNGVLFTPTAQINVGGLVASTLNLNTHDFLSGRYQFKGTSSNAIINQGHITAAKGGTIALIAAKMSNTGHLTANSGSVLLGAGSNVILDLGALVKIQVKKSAINALIKQGGVIKANGGLVYLTARAAGDLATTVINQTGIIEAQTLVKDKKGQIYLKGGMKNGTINVGGTLDASAPNRGHGGFVETSAAHVKIVNSTHVITLARKGKNGQWLIDPVDFTIAASGGDITGTALSTNLGSGNVTIASTSGTTGTAGDINVNDTLTWSANTLTLNAQNNINIYAVMNSSGAAKLILEYGQGAFAAGNTSVYSLHAPINLVAGNNFSTKLGSDGVAINYTVITSLGAAGSTTKTDLQGINGGLAANYVLGSNIDATATSGWNTNAGFQPIGNSTTPFTGTFDGLGHTIGSLNINRSTQDDIGLFGNTLSSQISNIGLVSGSVTGKNNVGGLVGNNVGSISTSYSTGTVTGSSNIGGLTGVNTSTISTSYATGSVNGTTYVGGLAGINNATIKRSYATNGVSGTSYIGGLVGKSASGTISTSYATGLVSGTNLVGGLAGQNFGTVNSSYWDITTTGQITSSGGAGLTTIQMQQELSFSGFDFVNNWIIYNTHTDPLLRIFMTPLTVTANNDAKIYDKVSYSGSPGVVYSAIPNANLLGTPSYGGPASGAVNAGSYNIAPSGLYSTKQQGGYAINFVAGNLTINSATISAVTGITGNNKVYDATTPANLKFSGAGFTGMLSGDVLSATSAPGNFTDKNVGTGKTVNISGISLGGVDAGNYTLSNTTATTTADITKANLAVTGLTALNKFYDTSKSVILSGTAAINPLGSDVVILGGSPTGSFADKKAGNSKMVTVTGNSISGAGAGNYNLVQQSGLTANINKANLLVTGITASDKVYDATSVATLGGTAVISPQGSDMVTLSGTATENFLNKNVGIGKAVTVSGITTSGADAGNYNLVLPVGLIASISKASISSVTGIRANNKVYNTLSVANLITTGAVFPGIFSGDLLDVATASGSFANKSAGTGKGVSIIGIKLGGADASNYTLLNTTASTTADITQAPLHVTGLSASNKTYDTTITASLTGIPKIIGVLSGDAVNVSGIAQGAFANKNVGVGKLITVTGNRISGIDAGNYNLVQQTGLTANISKATLVLTGLTARNKIYDATNIAYLGGTASIKPLGNDSVVTGGTANGRFSDKNVANGKLVTVNGNIIAGTDAGNYKLIQQSGLTANVTKANLMVKGLIANNRVYDATRVANLVGTASANVLGSDVVNVLGKANGVFADKNVGNGKTVSVAGNTLGGTDAGNYNLLQQTGLTANITKANISNVTGIVANNKTYDASTIATLVTKSAVFTGMLSGDALSVGAATGAFTDKNAGLAKSVSIKGISLSGTDAGNYSLLSTLASTTADILPRPITITAENKTKGAGQPDPILTYQLEPQTPGRGLIPGEAIGGALQRQPGTIPGRYAIQQGTLIDIQNPDYSINFVPGTLEINPIISFVAGSAIQAAQNSRMPSLKSRTDFSLNNNGIVFVAVRDKKSVGGNKRVSAQAPTTLSGQTRSRIARVFVLNGGINLPKIASGLFKAAPISTFP